MVRLRNGCTSLELLLLLAVVALVFQLFPAAWWWTIDMLDVRDWSRAKWFAMNILFLTVVVAIRVSPDIRRSFAEWKNGAIKRRERAERKRRSEERQTRRTKGRRVI